jgi:hypothetical protein
MDNYKIKRNPKPLSDEQISRHKDFNKLLGNHQKLHHFKDATKPMYKNIGFMSMMIVIGIVLLMLLLDNPGEKNAMNVSDDSSKVMPVENGTNQSLTQDHLQKNDTDKISEKVKQQSVITTTPFDKENKKAINYETYTIEPAKGAVFYSAHCRIIIPSFSFLDKKGNITSQEITLRYRELSSLQEAELKAEDNFNPAFLFEITAEESATKAPVTLSQPILLETSTPISDATGTVYKYSLEKEKWESSEKEKAVYRFSYQINDSEFPELKSLKDLIWEFPSENGKPSEFGYIFNRPWKNFNFTVTSDKKEISLKNSNTSFKKTFEFGALTGNKKENSKLIEAFYTIYNNIKGKPDQEKLKKAIQLIESWKNSQEGKEFIAWKSNSYNEQLNSNRKTSKLNLNSLGFICLNYPSQKSPSYGSSQRIIQLQKYPEKQQHFSQEEINNEPSLKR